MQSVRQAVGRTSIADTMNTINEVQVFSDVVMYGRRINSESLINSKRAGAELFGVAGNK